MSARRLEDICSAHRDELLRLICDDIAEPSPTLRAHLATCQACREALEASRDLLDSLRAALEPEPLPEPLVNDIHARLDGRTATRRGVWSGPLRVVCAAGAACLLAAILMPWGGSSPAIPTSGERAAGIELSEDDVAVIVAACTLLRWESPIEYSVAALADRVEEVVRTVERDADAHTVLPWGPEDDWDVPVGDADTSGVGAVQRVCAARNTWERTRKARGFSPRGVVSTRDERGCRVCLVVATRCECL